MHGYPSTIVSDRDKVFVDQLYSKLFCLSGMTIKFSSACHPLLDGQMEIVIRSLDTFLMSFGAQPKQ